MTFKSKADSGAKVKGSTVINHFIRCDLDLTLLEYTLLDFYQNNNDNVSQARDNFRKQLGFDIDDPIVDHCRNDLMKKVYLIKEENVYIPTAFWTRYFAGTEMFDSESADNPGIWQIFAASENPRGNKQLAMKAYVKAVKDVDPFILSEAAKKYIKYCIDSGRYSMHVSTWLNPKNKHWENEYPSITPKPEKPDDTKFNGIFIK